MKKKTPKKENVVVGPYLVCLTAIDRAGSIATDIVNELNLNRKDTIDVMSECLKSEIAVIWSNTYRQKEIGNLFYNSLILETIEELKSNTPDLPELYELISHDQNSWQNDIIEYYIRGKLDRKAKEWVSSKLWWGDNDPNSDDAWLLQIALRLHYRIFKILGKTSSALAREKLTLYIDLTSHFISCQDEIWSSMKFQLENPS